MIVMHGRPLGMVRPRFLWKLRGLDDFVEVACGRRSGRHLSSEEYRVYSYDTKEIIIKKPQQKWDGTVFFVA